MGAISPAAQFLVLGGSMYARLRNAAIAAARRNNASLWFAGAPADLAGFVFQDSAGTTPATGTDPIGLLRDRTGAFNATQATAANKPTLELQGNGYFGMRFDGANDSLQTAFIANGSSTTILAALAHSATVSGNSGSRQASTDRVFIGHQTTSGNVVTGQGASAGTDVSPAESMLLTPKVASLVITQPAATAQPYVGGVAKSLVGISGTTNPNIGSYFGAVNRAGTAAEFASETIFLFAQSANAMPDADRIAIERFAALLSGATYA